MKKLLIILTALLLCFGADAQSRRTSGKVKKQQQQTEKQIRQTDAQIKETNRKITSSLNDLNRLNIEIENCNTAIASLKARIDSIDKEITGVKDSMMVLDERLARMKESMSKVLGESRRSRTEMGNLAFIFSSDSFVQAYRRLRALKQFSKWRERKAQEINGVKALLDDRQRELEKLEADSREALSQLATRRSQLQTKQNETDKIVKELKGQEKQLKKVLEKQRATAADLDNELNRLIAQEKREAEEKARKEAEEKARKEAAEKARREAEERARLEAEEKARQEAAEKARVQAEQEARAQKEQTERDKKAKQQQEKAAAEKAKKEQALREKQEKEAAKKAKAEEEKAKKSSPRADRKKVKGKKGKEAENTPAAQPTQPAPSADNSSSTTTVAKVEPISDTFADNKGRLAYPVDRPFSIVKRFGRQRHPSLPYVETDNSGIDLQTSPGASVRSVYDGEVSAIFCPDGYNNVVVVRHGDYVTVYANLDQLSVRKGDKIKRGQALGRVYIDKADNNRSILHFEIRNATTTSNIIKENPEDWLR